MPNILLNCDLGEWESASQSNQLIPMLDLANIACGGHAGDTATLQHCASLARQHGVRAGAHPGLPGEQGRADASHLTPAAFTALLSEQIQFFERHAGLPPSHIKLHGSLYHLSESSPEIRLAYLSFAANRRIPVVAMAGGHVATDASAMGLPLIPEVFLDRGYQADGNLIPRGEPGALITSASKIISRCEELLHSTAYPITACIHSDSPAAIELLLAARTTIDTHRTSHF